MKTVFSLAALAVCTTLLTGCNTKTEQSVTTDTVNVKLLTVGAADSGTEASGSSFSGTVEEENGTALSFSTGGTLTQLRVKVGDHVTKGQLIATVDPTSMRNAYDMALSTRKQAEDAYARMKQLHDKGSLPEMKWVEVQSQLQQAVSSENIAKKSLADCQLYAPVSGVVSEKNAEVGQNVAPGIAVVKIVTTQVLNVRIAVPETEVSAVGLHQLATITVPALNGRQFHGQVIEKGVIADPISRSYSVKIRVADAASTLLPGMVTKVSLFGKSSSTATASSAAEIVIPANLVQLADDNSNFVWVAEGGKAARRTVVCGGYRSNGVVITSGLKSGDRVIVEGQQKVARGTVLNVKQ